MHFFKPFAIFCVLIAGSPANADECWICDDVVELNATYAECYRSNFDILMAAFEAKGLERQQINFAGCSDEGESVGTRGGLLRMGILPSTPTSSKTVYTLSRDSALCLKELLDTYEGNLDPSVVFRLNEQCGDE